MLFVWIQNVDMNKMHLQSIFHDFWINVYVSLDIFSSDPRHLTEAKYAWYRLNTPTNGGSIELCYLQPKTPSFKLFIREQIEKLTIQTLGANGNFRYLNN